MTLTQRFERELGLSLERAEAEGRLPGFFNRYRPNGEGLERLFEQDGLEADIRDRLLNLFRASSDGWSPGDLYFVVRRPPPLEPARRLALAQRRAVDLAQLAELAQGHEAIDFLRTCRVVEQAAAGAVRDDDLLALATEGGSDFLIELDRSRRHEVFRLREAFYSIAADETLVEYVLWPATAQWVDADAPFHSGYELWRHGLRLVFLDDGTATALPV